MMDAWMLKHCIKHCYESMFEESVADYISSPLIQKIAGIVGNFTFGLSGFNFKFNFHFINYPSIISNIS